jgi:hypothetical protein
MPGVPIYGMPGVAITLIYGMPGIPIKKCNVKKKWAQ